MQIFLCFRFPGFQATPLGAAIKNCDIDIVRALLGAKADVNHVLTVYLDGDVDFNAQQCVQKTAEGCKSGDVLDLKRLDDIRSLLLQHQVYIFAHFFLPACF